MRWWCGRNGQAKVKSDDLSALVPGAHNSGMTSKHTQTHIEWRAIDLLKPICIRLRRFIVSFNCDRRIPRNHHTLLFLHISVGTPNAGVKDQHGSGYHLARRLKTRTYTHKHTFTSSQGSKPAAIVFPCICA